MNHFEALGLPVAAVDRETLRDAYERQRQMWFFRQYDPEFVSQAGSQLAAIEQAYAALKERAGQSAYLRELNRQQATATVEAPNADLSGGSPDNAGDVSQADPDASEAEAPTLTPRTQIVRKMMQAAESLARTKKTLDRHDYKHVTELGFTSGLPYADATELAQRIISQLENDRR